jgi:hypothetical protein
MVHAPQHRLHQLQLVRCQDRVDRIVKVFTDRVHLRGEVLAGERRRSGIEDLLNPVVVLPSQRPHFLLLIRRELEVLRQATDLLLDILHRVVVLLHPRAPVRTRRRLRLRVLRRQRGLPVGVAGRDEQTKAHDEEYRSRLHSVNSRISERLAHGELAPTSNA